MNTVLIGADPELFVRAVVGPDPTHYGDWEVVPAFGKFGGSKGKPLAMTGMDDGFFYLEDNAALEFNIPPQQTAEAWWNAVVEAKRWIRDNLIDPKQLQFSDTNYLELKPKFLASAKAQEVGCSSDYDAYAGEGGMQRDPFSADTLGRMRYAGGHIHLSYNHAVVPHFVAARFLDLYLTLPWIDWDHQPRRRATYGKAGLYRPKQYGIEYRTPSNWWLWTSDSLAQTYAENALHFARRSYEADFINALSEAYVSMPWDLVQQAIAREDGYAGQMLVEMANNRFGLGIRGPR